jgi:integrase
MASIMKRGNGQWRARYRDDVEREHARHFDRKVDAQQWLNEVTASLVTGTYVDPKAGSVTFERFYAQWSQRQVWVPSTRVNADHAAASVPFAQLPLKSLRRSHVEQWVKAMSKDLAATTIHTRVAIVRSVLLGAVADRVISVDPSGGVTLPRRRRREAAMQVPSVEQVGRILGGADDDFRAFVALCAFAGLRLGEAAGVQVGDVDFLRRQLSVSRQLQRDGREVAVRPPKYGSERVVYLPEQLVTMLSEHVATYRSDGEPGRWLFADLGGLPLHNNAVTYRWRQTRKAAGTPSIRLHDLRHFYASGLIAAGCDVVTVQRALGHSSATTTLNTYSHLWPTAEDRTRAAAGELWTAALADSLRTSEVH